MVAAAISNPQIYAIDKSTLPLAYAPDGQTHGTCLMVQSPKLKTPVQEPAVIERDRNGAGCPITLRKMRSCRKEMLLRCFWKLHCWYFDAWVSVKCHQPTGNCSKTWYLLAMPPGLPTPKQKSGTCGKAQTGGSIKESTEGPGTAASPIRTKCPQIEIRTNQWRKNLKKAWHLEGTLPRPVKSPVWPSQAWRCFLAKSASTRLDCWSK